MTEINRRDAISTFLAALPATAVVSRLEAKPGATLVIECAERISTVTAERIREQLIAAFPGYRAILLAPGMTLKVLDVDV